MVKKSPRKYLGKRASRLPISGEGICKNCGDLKPYSSEGESCFYIDYRTENLRLKQPCKKCQHEARGEHRRNNPKLASDTARRSKIKRLFGITQEQYEIMLEHQNNVCAICERVSPDGRRLHIDHCHKTKKVRGLLCHDCNRALGMMMDNPKLFFRAANYLLAYEHSQPVAVNKTYRRKQVTNPITANTGVKSWSDIPLDLRCRRRGG